MNKPKLTFFKSPTKEEKKEKKVVLRPIIRSLPKRGQKRESIYIPICRLPVVPRVIESEDSDIRRLEYLNELSDLAGTTEGMELESLGNVAHEMYKKFTFKRVEDEELENVVDEQES